MAAALKCGLYTSQVVWVMLNICQSYACRYVSYPLLRCSHRCAQEASDCDTGATSTGGSTEIQKWFYQSHADASSVSSGNPDCNSNMGGDLLDVILVKEASKSTMIHNATYYYTFGRPSYRGLTQASRTLHVILLPFPSPEPQEPAMSVSALKTRRRRSPATSPGVQVVKDYGSGGL